MLGRLRCSLHQQGPLSPITRPRWVLNNKMLQLLGFTGLAKFCHNLALVLHHIYARRLFPDTLRGKSEKRSAGGLKELLREPYEFGGNTEEVFLALFFSSRHRKSKIERKKRLDAGDAHGFTGVGIY